MGRPTYGGTAQTFLTISGVHSPMTATTASTFSLPVVACCCAWACQCGAQVLLRALGAVLMGWGSCCVRAVCQRSSTTGSSACTAACHPQSTPLTRYALNWTVASLLVYSMPAPPLCLTPWVHKQPLSLVRPPSLVRPVPGPFLLMGRGLCCPGTVSAGTFAALTRALQA